MKFGEYTAHRIPYIVASAINAFGADVSLRALEREYTEAVLGMARGQRNRSSERPGRFQA